MTKICICSCLCHIGITVLVNVHIIGVQKNVEFRFCVRISFLIDYSLNRAFTSFTMAEYAMLCIKNRLNRNLTRYLQEQKQCSPLLYSAMGLLKFEFPENVQEIDYVRQRIESYFRLGTQLEVEYWTINWTNIELIRRFNQFVDAQCTPLAAL